MRIVEFIIGLMILAAIASTFFLYRTHTVSSILAPTLTETMATSPQVAAVSTTDIGDGTVTTLAPEEPTKQISVINVESTSATTTDIVVEKIPLSKTETKTITSLIHSLSSLSRSQNNLPSLTLDTRLTALATERSVDMIEHDYFSHTARDGCDLTCRFAKAHYNALSWGENLATSPTLKLYTHEELAKTFLEEWLKSSTHRDNLLSPKFTHYGIGLSEKDNRIVVTVLFAKPQ